MASIVLAGGGTAGHVEPALAVARAWKLEQPDDRITFLGTSQGLENTLVPAAGFDLFNIPKVVVARKPSLQWLRVPIDLLASVRAAKKALRNADLLIGFGGYVSAPAYIAARISNVPIVIHEANIKPGWANKLGSLFTKNLGVSRAVNSRAFSQALLTGLPLRQDVAKALNESEGNWEIARRDAKARLGFDNSKPLVFVMGGSQGSVAINSVISEVLPQLAGQEISILHSIGRQNSMPESKDFYRPIAYVENMADAYLASDLVIARSGAVTCSEFTALGRYALFIPLPIGNGEQFLNAQPLVSDGRAEIVTQEKFTPEFLIKQLSNLLTAANSAPMAGSNVDENAAQKIVALGLHAMGKIK